MTDTRSNVAVVGHVEWVQFGHVEHLPRSGEVAHARGAFEEPAGGGAVAAAQLARLAGGATLFTALGEDEHARRAIERLAMLGVHVSAGRAAPTKGTGGDCGSPAATRRAVTLIDDGGERTITTFGPRLDPAGAAISAMPAALDSVYFTAGDLDALRLARERARVLVASPRARAALGAGVRLDALVLSGEDEIELREARRGHEEAEVVVFTGGAAGGRYRTREGLEGRWTAAPLPGPPVDSYGCGDSFAAGLTYALGRGIELDAALELAARCGATCLTGAGPYGRQLSAAELDG